MTRRDKFIIWLLVSVLIFELMLLYTLLYFTRPEELLLFLAGGLRIVSPFFLLFNICFLIFSIFTKGIEFTAKFWKTYFREYLKFLLISLTLGVLLVCISVVFGVFTGIALKKAYSISSLKELFQQLRNWVNKQLY
jgi:ABC-type spermidine/putrescine transport system permease subunit II